MKYLVSFFLIVVSNSVPLTGQIHNPKNIPYTWNTDTLKRDVDLSDLYIAAEINTLPVLNYPQFIGRKDHYNHYYEFEPVIAIEFGGRAKAYPLSILTMYELANDSLGGKELMITYCPMCNAAIVFDRHVEFHGVTKLLNFGVSGLLMHNDMVMFDRETESWWEQLMGSGIVGEYSGATLEFMPALLISVKDFFDRYPEGEILSPHGVKMIRSQHHRQFHHLEHDSVMHDEFFIPEHTDPRLPALEHVIDIHIHDHTTIYPYHVLANKKVLNDSFNGTYFVIFYHGETVSVLDEDRLKKSKHVGNATAFRSSVDGINLTFTNSGQYFTDDQTGSVWDITGHCREGKLAGKQLWIMPHSNHFAFAYLAFYPESQIYEEK